jgi:hypothetical protein
MKSDVEKLHDQLDGVLKDTRDDFDALGDYLEQHRSLDDEINRATAIQDAMYDYWCGSGRTEVRNRLLEARIVNAFNSLTNFAMLIVLILILVKL